MIREAFLHLRRGGLQALFTALVLAVTLFCFGAFSSGLEFADRVLGLLKSDLTVAVYLEDGVQKFAVEGMLAKLKLWPEVREAAFRDKDAAMQRYRAMMGPESADLFRLLEGNPLPESILVTVDSVAGATRVAERIRKEMSLYVSEICFSADAYDRISALLVLARSVGAAVLAGLLVVAAGAVFMAIALGVDGRREEIEIMLLVGATRFFVGAPYVIEAALLGLAGSLGAIGGLFLLKGALHAFFLAKIPAAAPLVADLPSLQAVAAVLVVGVLLAMAGSLIGLRRRLTA